MSELDLKLNVVQKLLDEKNLDALLLMSNASFSWATCGASAATNSSSSNGSASLLITPDNRYLITSNTEAPRLEQEEGLKEQGWEFTLHPWYESPDLVVDRLIQGKKVGADGVVPGTQNVSVEMARLRSRMTPPEQEHFKQLGRECAAAMGEAVHAIHVEMSEFEISSLMAAAAEKRGIRAVVNLVAVDARVFTYRHPLPTEKQLKNLAMIVLCGRKWGLICSLTRFVHFGALPDELREKAKKVARVDAAFIANSIPGSTLGQVFSVAQDVYRKIGFPDEWTILHQGGIAGYEPREFTAVPGSEEVIHTGQFLAWNPTISGIKSEDTIFIGNDGIEIITEMEGWPVVEVEYEGKLLNRPAILQKKR